MTFPIINYFPTIFFCASLGKMTTQLFSQETGFHQ